MSIPSVTRRATTVDELPDPGDWEPLWLLLVPSSPPPSLLVGASGALVVGVELYNNRATHVTLVCSKWHKLYNVHRCCVNQFSKHTILSIKFIPIPILYLTCTFNVHFQMPKWSTLTCAHQLVQCIAAVDLTRGSPSLSTCWSDRKSEFDHLSQMMSSLQTPSVEKILYTHLQIVHM